MNTANGASIFGRQEPKKEIRAILELDRVERVELKRQSFQTSILDSQLRDITWKIKTRARFGYSLLGLLFVQNVIAFGLVITAYIQGNLPDLEVIFGILIPATLLETAYSIKIIVEWLFKDINYTENK